MPSLDDASTAFLVRAVELAALARAHGNHPFGAVLVAADGTTVEAENTVVTQSDPTGHAETNLVRASAAQLTPEALSTSTLYTSTEPCAMCSGAIFWAGIPTVVFALSEEALYGMLPPGSGEHVLALPSREVFARGGRTTDVIGPIDLPEAVTVHHGFWG